MAEAWQTLEEAALTLGISSRTLHRRLARGEFQTRMANGRREVLVVVDERDPSLDRLAAAATRASVSANASAAASDTTDTPPATDATAYSTEDYNSTIEHAADEVQQTMLALHEDRIRRTDLAIMAYQQSVTVAAADARRALTRSRVAWSVAGILTVALSLGGMWATHRLTQASGQVSHLSDNVRQLSETVEVKTREIKELRADAQTARVSAARAEGELAAAKRQVEQLTEAQQAAAMAAARLTTQVAAATAADTSEKPTTQPAGMSVNATSAQLAGGAATSQPSATTQPAQR